MAPSSLTSKGFTTMHKRDKVVLMKCIQLLNDMNKDDPGNPPGHGAYEPDSFKSPNGFFRFRKELKLGFYTYRFYEAFDGDGPPSVLITGWEDSDHYLDTGDEDQRLKFILQEFDSVITIIYNAVEENFKEPAIS